MSEMALSLVLLIAAALLLRSFVLLQRADLGTTKDPASVLTFNVAPKLSANADQQDAAAVQFSRRALERIATVPGVKRVAISDSMPPDHSGEDDTFRIAGKPWTQQEFPSTSLPRITADYFRLLGVPLIRGRLFTEDDTATSRPVTIISHSLARRYFGDKDPIGQALAASGPGTSPPYMEIVGVVGDVKYWGTDNEAKQAYYLPFAQNPSGSMFVIVEAEHAAQLTPAMEHALRDVDRDLVIRRVLTLQEAIDDSIAQPRVRTGMLVSFAMTALLLAGVGLYGVIAYSVSQRTHEIGVRMALGAKRIDVLAMVLAEAAKIAGFGMVVGTILSLALSRMLTAFLFQTRPYDAAAILTSCAVLSITALIGSAIPAGRATMLDPAVALRHE